MRIRKRLLVAVVSLFAAISIASGADADSRVINGGFEAGLTAWQAAGEVHLETNHPVAGKISAQIGPGMGTLSQRIDTGSGNHLTVSATIEAATTNGWVFALRFLDKDGQELMRVDSLADLKPAKKDPRKFSHYLKVHPLTEWVEMVISNGTAGSSIVVDDVGLKMADENTAATQTTVDLDQAMQPFWQGKTIFNEAVLMRSQNGQPATGQLMFRPTKVISVQDYDLTTNYFEGMDFTVDGRTLTRTATSRMTQVRDQDLLKGELKWNHVGGQQVMVTYEHDDVWTLPLPAFLGDELPGTMKKLGAHAPLKIVAFGDSITHGVGASRLSHIPPFQPPWADLFAHRLQTIYHDTKIQLYNSAQSGADAHWAKTMAGRMVATLAPDLVLVAFGQNDFWSYSANAFSNNIAGVIQTVREKNPAAEFLLVSTMRFDPAYTTNLNYWKRVGQYAATLKAMTGPGVQLVDMTALTELLYAAKKPKDFLNDPLHPNDYLARWYAQSLAAALDRNSGLAPGTQGPFRSKKKGVGHYGRNAAEAVDLLGCSWFYNWESSRSADAKNVQAEYVPMIWGRNVDAELEAVKPSSSTALLGFNEPDNKGQANMSVADAIADWPKLMATGLRLGSPAPTTGNHWLDDFMTEARNRNLRVDFLCLHWYGDITKPNAVESLRKYLQGYWDRYHLPIWLTEYSGADFDYSASKETQLKTTVQDNAEFAAKSLVMLEDLPFVERYAWFSTRWTPHSKGYTKVGLYDAETRTLTPVGVAYRGVAR